MSKMSELDIVLQGFHTAAQALIDACESMRVFYSQGNELPATDAPNVPSEPKPATITLEQVRGVLADKSRAGFTAEVRELLLKHRAAKLSEIDPKEYGALLAEAERLGNG